jgi:hypothetical protein
MSTVNPATDKTLVSRAGVDYSAPADMSTVQDTDLLLINRAGVDYKCTFADWKASQTKAPNVGTVTLSDVAGGARFTSTAFPVSATMVEDGTPKSDKKLKAYVEGALKVNPLSSAIVSIGPPPPTYLIQRSIRLNTSDSAYLSRTPASAGNRKTWTWAGWVKRVKLNTFSPLWSVGLNADADTDRVLVAFGANDKLIFDGGTTSFRATTDAYGDPSSWYHVLFSVDTTQVTANNRIKIYINGAEVKAFDVLNNPPQNADTGVNRTSAHNIGRRVDPGDYYASLYLADIHFIDGQALTPSSFGEFDTNGVWQPKAYSGSYGTNGFKLAFADNSAATATTLGKDTSGNGNNWTPNNLSVTAGAGNDSLVDTPTNYGTDTGAGGEVRGNYCTWNPLDLVSISVENGNLQTSGSTTTAGISGTIGVSSGKWYWEVTAGSVEDCIGIWPTSSRITGCPGYTSDSYGYYGNTGTKINNSSTLAYGATFTANDVIGVALDLYAGTLTFYKNNVSQGTAFTGLSGGFRPAVRAGSSSAPSTATYANFGQRPFAYTAPSGFKALVKRPDMVLTLTDSTQLASFAANNAVTEVGNGNDGTGVVKSVNAAGPTITLDGQPNGWNVGSQVQGPPKALAGGATVKLYCKLNAAGDVKDLQSADPGFIAWPPTGTGPYTGTVTFPATLPSGNAPDADLPAGTTLTVEVEASNTAGTDSAKSNVITPA